MCILRKLGGLRHARRDSTNMGWRNASFRGFADYADLGIRSRVTPICRGLQNDWPRRLAGRIPVFQPRGWHLITALLKTRQSC